MSYNQRTARDSHQKHHRQKVDSIYILDKKWYEINQCPVICLNKQTKTYALYRLWFQQHGLTLSPSIEAATADQILPLVRSGLGIGFVPESFLQDESECTGIDHISLKEPVPTRFISLVKHKNRSLSIAAAALEKTILAYHPKISQG